MNQGQDIPKFNADYGSEEVVAYLSECKRLGYMITYNHPTKSCQVMPEYLKYSEVDNLEIINYSSLMEGYDEYNGVCYDNFLRRNNRLFCCANDGNRNLYPLDSKRSDSFGVTKKPLFCSNALRIFEESQETPLCSKVSHSKVVE